MHLRSLVPALAVLVTTATVVAQSDDPGPSSNVYLCECLASYTIDVADEWTVEENIIGTSAACSPYDAEGASGCDDLDRYCTFDVRLEGTSDWYTWTIEEPQTQDFAWTELSDIQPCSGLGIFEFLNDVLPDWQNSPYSGDVIAELYLTCSGCTVMFGS
ncbi:MAG: hypothetical protein AAGA20_02035 [Planctomycetota bacterium]